MRVLFVGLGSIGQRHLRNLRALRGDGVDVMAWRALGRNQVITNDLCLEGGVDLQQRYGVRVMATLEDALSEQPHLTYVCNPSSMHVPVALAAVRAGSHVFVEKPLSHDLTDVPLLIEEARERGLVGYVGYQLRFHPAILELQRLLADDAVGSPLAVLARVAEYLPSFHPYEDYREMYASRRALGGGVVLSQIHELDYLTLLLGMPRRVFAQGGKLSGLEIDVEDVAQLAMDFGTANRPLPATLHMDYLQHPPSRGCEIICDRGKIMVDLRKPCLVQYDRRGDVAVYRDWPNFVRNELFVAQTRHLLAACEGLEEPRCTLSDAVKSTQIALAALKALESGEVVKLAP